MSSNKFLKNVKYFMRFVPDATYIQLYYFAHFKKFCNLKNPVTYNEKLNWLKLNYHDPLLTELVDKSKAKKYVAKIIGKEYIIPTLGIWDNFDEINFDELPQSFVLKCTHDSEGVVIVKDKENFDKSAAKIKLEKSLSQNFFYIGREWPYKNVKPRILAEKYMEDASLHELRDYKFFCFSGVPKIMFIASDRAKGTTKFDYFDMDFKHLQIRQKYPNSKKKIIKPQNFELMKNFATELSKSFPHVRVDFYDINGKLYFGELTFYHFSGFTPFHPSTWDNILGSWLKLPTSKK